MPRAQQGAVSLADGAGGTAGITEIKKRSRFKIAIRAGFLPAEIAADQEMHGSLPKPKRDKLRIPQSRTEPAMGTLEFLKERREHIFATAVRHGAGNVRVFGSVLRGAETPESGIDLLVEFAPDRSLLDLVGLQIDLETLLGRRTDVVTEASLSPYLRDRILLEARSL